MTSMAPIDELLHLVEEIDNHDATCSLGEEKFVQACRRILASRGTLDDDEVARLETILDTLDRRAEGRAEDETDYYDDEDDEVTELELVEDDDAPDDDDPDDDDPDGDDPDGDDTGAFEYDTVEYEESGEIDDDD